MPSPVPGIDSELWAARQIIDTLNTDNGPVRVVLAGPSRNQAPSWPAGSVGTPRPSPGLRHAPPPPHHASCITPTPGDTPPPIHRQKQGRIALTFKASSTPQHTGADPLPPYRETPAGQGDLGGLSAGASGSPEVQQVATDVNTRHDLPPAVWPDPDFSGLFRIKAGYLIAARVEDQLVLPTDQHDPLVAQLAQVVCADLRADSLPTAPTDP
ncbi:hypothetical protein [Mycobacterium sp. URHB0021]